MLQLRDFSVSLIWYSNRKDADCMYLDLNEYNTPSNRKDAAKLKTTRKELEDTRCQTLEWVW